MNERSDVRYAPRVLLVPALALAACSASSGGGDAGHGSSGIVDGATVRTDVTLIASVDSAVVASREATTADAAGAAGGEPLSDASGRPDAVLVDATPDCAADASCEAGAGSKDASPHDAAPACTAAAACDGGACVAGVCVASTCSDAVMDGNETGVDCGGSCAGCGGGGDCLVAADCTSLDCTGTIAATATTPAVHGVCQAPTCTDGIRNEGESDVDCGGGACPACAAAKTCEVDLDCASDGCDYTGRCALAASCTLHHGGDTCGAGEDTDLGAKPAPATGEESCCTSLPIAGTTMILDKYLITAGRIRAWVSRWNGNLRAFTESIPASNPNWNASWNRYIPSTLDEVDAQLGPYPAPLTPTPYSPSDFSLDSLGLPIGNWLGQWRDGCSMGSPGMPDGARTWWTDHALGSDAAPIAYPQEFLDDKIINCIDSYMLTAFCIWDGGHLATDAEMAAAWGAGPFPWSATAPDVLIDQTSQEPVGTDALGRDASAYVVHEFGLSPAEFVAPYTYKYDPYGLGADNTVHIPAPGRFPLGAGPSGHMDLAGATYEATRIVAGSTGMEPPPTPTVLKQVDYVGTLTAGTWEIHPILSGTGTEEVYPGWMPAYWAYWAMGSRCGR